MATESFRSHGPDRALLVLSQVYAEGGIQRFNRMLLAALHELGVRCDVLTLSDSEESRVKWNPPESATVQVFNRRKVRFAASVGRAIGRGAHDLIVIGHINFLSLVAGSLMFRATPRTRVLLVAHGIEVWNGMDNAITKWAIARVQRILCVSRYTRQRIEQQRPEIAKECFTLFPNALSATWQQPLSGSDSGAVPGKLTGPFLLSVTRLDEGDRYKGVATLIETLGMLSDTSLQCVIAGDGNDRSYLEGMARRCGVWDRVHFVGRVCDADLAWLYSECVAFVLPSGKEGFGIVFLEAMHFGAPVIAARERGAVDVVEHDQTGLLVSYGDTVGLAKAIRRLLNGPDLREKLIRNGRVLVSTRGPFSFQAFVGRLGALLELPLPHADVESEGPSAGMADEPVAEVRVRLS